MVDERAEEEEEEERERGWLHGEEWRKIQMLTEVELMDSLIIRRNICSWLLLGVKRVRINWQVQKGLWGR